MSDEPNTPDNPTGDDPQEDKNLPEESAAADDSDAESVDENEVAAEGAESAGQPDSESSEADAKEPEKVVNSEDESEENAEDAMLKMLEDLPEEESSGNIDDISFDSPEVSHAEFQQLSEPAGKIESRNIEMLMDVTLPVSIVLGKTRMAISDILALGQGSVVELNKLAGEPVDVLVNNKAVARGEVVVIDENFGVRITQLLTAEERLRLLGDE